MCCPYLILVWNIIYFISFFRYFLLQIFLYSSCNSSISLSPLYYIISTVRSSLPGLLFFTIFIIFLISVNVRRLISYSSVPDSVSRTSPGICSVPSRFNKFSKYCFHFSLLCLVLVLYFLPYKINFLTWNLSFPCLFPDVDFNQHNLSLIPSISFSWFLLFCAVLFLSFKVLLSFFFTQSSPINLFVSIFWSYWPTRQSHKNKNHN